MKGSNYMTRKFKFNFVSCNGQKYRIYKIVTDEQEPRDNQKPLYAVEYFNYVLKTKYGYKKSVVTVRNIEEVKQCQ